MNSFSCSYYYNLMKQLFICLYHMFFYWNYYEFLGYCINLNIYEFIYCIVFNSVMSFVMESYKMLVFIIIIVFVGDFVDYVIFIYDYYYT